ncbi:hypothetical protein KQX54_016407 [Cotesia glomerata]|uniref:Uncharacterized protein n=1 Tax=Cotesia glomerata TaxID=32391 RepID=A0AAV7I2Z7_COTGL|nr:hypothetical protein KQX54_016407 [Cotesia glomerata]
MKNSTSKEEPPPEVHSDLTGSGNKVADDPQKTSTSTAADKRISDDEPPSEVNSSAVKNFIETLDHPGKSCTIVTDQDTLEAKS